MSISPYTTRYETACFFHTNDLFTCVLTDTLLAHLPVPLALFTTTQPDNVVSVDISAYVDVFPMDQYTIMDAGTEPLEDLCTFAYNLLGIQIGVVEITNEGSPLVQQSLIVAGAPLVITHPDVTRVELYNAVGQLLMERTIIPGEGTITGTERATGVHFLRAFDHKGSQVGVQRVMIE